jgi:hypothetical protein
MSEIKLFYFFLFFVKQTENKHFSSPLSSTCGLEEDASVNISWDIYS